MENSIRTVIEVVDSFSPALKQYSEQVGNVTAQQNNLNQSLIGSENQFGKTSQAAADSNRKIKENSQSTADSVLSTLQGMGEVGSAFKSITQSIDTLYSKVNSGDASIDDYFNAVGSTVTNVGKMVPGVVGQIMQAAGVVIDFLGDVTETVLDLYSSTEYRLEKLRSKQIQKTKEWRTELINELNSVPAEIASQAEGLAEDYLSKVSARLEAEYIDSTDSFFENIFGKDDATETYNAGMEKARQQAEAIATSYAEAWRKKEKAINAILEIRVDLMDNLENAYGKIEDALEKQLDYLKQLLQYEESRSVGELEKYGINVDIEDPDDVRRAIDSIYNYLANKNAGTSLSQNPFTLMSDEQLLEYVKGLERILGLKGDISQLEDESYLENLRNFQLLKDIGIVQDENFQNELDYINEALAKYYEKWGVTEGNLEALLEESNYSEEILELLKRQQEIAEQRRQQTQEQKNLQKDIIDLMIRYNEIYYKTSGSTVNSGLASEIALLQQKLGMLQSELNLLGLIAKLSVTTINSQSRQSILDQQSNQSLKERYELMNAIKDVQAEIVNLKMAEIDFNIQMEKSGYRTLQEQINAYRQLLQEEANLTTQQRRTLELKLHQLVKELETGNQLNTEITSTTQEIRTVEPRIYHFNISQTNDFSSSYFLSSTEDFYKNTMENRVLQTLQDYLNTQYNTYGSL